MDSKMNIAFFSHKFLVEREVMAALKKLPYVRLITVKTATYSPLQQVEKVIKALTDHAPSILVTVNDWGMDLCGMLAEWLEARGILHVNWCVDDPFFIEAMKGVVFGPRKNRFDFVSDRGYVQSLRLRGHNAHFLPLATDPSIFYPLPEKPATVYPISFVGNSYKKDLNDFSKGSEAFLEQRSALIFELLAKYTHNANYDLDTDIAGVLERTILPEGISPAKAAFLIKYSVGYFFRKRLIVGLANTRDEFRVIGDAFWYLDLPQQRVVVGKSYYSDLNTIYQQTAVNIDINRVIIRDGFTQRVFDCLASGSFVLTSPKAVVNDFFITEGSARELVVFENETHLKELAGYYVSREHERRTIAERGMKKVLACHTYDHRIAEIMRTLAGDGVEMPVKA
jgi:spore maturation protein CgeB